MHMPKFNMNSMNWVFQAHLHKATQHMAKDSKDLGSYKDNTYPKKKQVKVT